MNKDRLLTLARYLPTVKVETFKLSDWQCGVAACAVGHACSIPEFQAEGLTLCAVTPGSTPRSTLAVAAVPSYRNERGWDAVKEFFDLSYDDAEYLFSRFRYPGNVTPTDVADRIMNFTRVKRLYDLHVFRLLHELTKLLRQFS